MIRELEQAFGAPVIESYGMTEAAHQVASNPLPPAMRKPGTVGRAAGPKLAIIDAVGQPVGPAATGEIAIRGDNVMRGYENDPEANAKAFVNGWFRTGDQGVMDAESYITITGRLKEIINRGGEKIAPREVEEVLMDHPAVAQCVAFALPHEKLGEEVAVAAVLREGRAATDKELQEFARARLADFKVPRMVLILAEIPKGPTGKVQRTGLAQKLGLG
ncbi:MAG TPA: AMP-binding protein [Burkholderiaceae bacterium]|nr:AMP-binding protein [Burkholderiaceae bacterium]